MKIDKLLTIILGLGLALIPIHRVNFIFEGFGLGLTLIAVTGIIILRLKEHKLTLGPKYVYIPLTIVAVSMLVSESALPAKLLAFVLFAVYIAGLNLRQELKLLVPAVVVGSISIVVCNLVEGSRTGGIYFMNNYNLAIGAIILGTLLCRVKYHWILVSVVLAALAFSGAEEALVALALLGITLLIRRDWSKRLLLSAGVLTLVVLVCTLLGTTKQLWFTYRVEAASQQNWGAVSEGRLDAWKTSIVDIKPFGHGYEPFNVKYGSIHNVPLRILYEVGPAAAAAWLFALIYALIKTKRKYLIVAMLALSLFDHFLWTQLCVYMFVAIGISVRNDTIDDLIFRRA